MNLLDTIQGIYRAKLTQMIACCVALLYVQNTIEQ